MILTAAFIIAKALGVSWSWWWIAATIIGDDFGFYLKERRRQCALNYRERLTTR